MSRLAEVPAEPDRFHGFGSSAGDPAAPPPSSIAIIAVSSPEEPHLAADTSVAESVGRGAALHPIRQSRAADAVSNEDEHPPVLAIVLGGCRRSYRRRRRPIL